ncbi:MAG TPA: hypothetical protein VE869_18015 [Gemmatimonas sp.]|nr:hypothetical protein [Gemmatimonas sp.]
MQRFLVRAMLGAFAFASLSGITRLDAQAVPAAASGAAMPTVAGVYDKFATAVGGRDAWAQVVGRTEKGTVNVTFAGLTGSYTRYNGAPNRIRMIIDLDVTKIDQGFDGKVGWTAQGDGPATRMPADVEANTAETARTGNSFLDATRFKEAKVAGVEEFDGVQCYKLDIVTITGDKRTDYFETATGLRRGTVTSAPTGMQTATFREYKAFDGKKVATLVTQKTDQGDVVITITDVVFGEPAAGVFTSPLGGGGVRD